MGGLTGHREELSKMRMFVVDSRGGNVFFFFSGGSGAIRGERMDYSRNAETDSQEDQK